MSNLRLFEHPANRKLFGVGVPKLYISGTLPGSLPEVAYEGRLQIINAGGDCTAWLTAGELPPGSTVSVDNTTKEIVVAWPAYEAAAVAIPNAGLESGDDGWLFGPGWSVTTDNPVSGAKALQYLDHGGDSVVSNTMRADIAPGTPITAGCAVRQGASSKGNAGACVRLEFFDAAGNMLAPAEGNMVLQGDNNEVHPSTVSTVSPSNVDSVRIAARGFRKRQNKKVWVDDFYWNVAQPSVGTNVSGQWCITLRVRDALGREAEWSGCISVLDIPLPFAHWPLQETAGSIAQDVGPLGRNLTYTNPVTLAYAAVAPGQGPAARFLGGYARVAGPNPDLSMFMGGPAGSIPGSIAVWIKPEAKAGGVFRLIACKMHNASAGFVNFLVALQPSPSTAVRFATGSDTHLGGGSCPDGALSLIVCTMGQGQQNIYVNGTLAATKVATGNFGLNGNESFEIGSDNSFDSSYGYRGVIGDLMLWNDHELTPEQVQLLYEIGPIG